MEDEKKEEATTPPQPSEEKVEGAEPKKDQPEPFDYKAELEKTRIDFTKGLNNLAAQIRKSLKGEKEEVVIDEPEETVEEKIDKAVNKKIAESLEAQAKLMAENLLIKKESEQVRKANQSQQTMGNAGGEGGQKISEDSNPLDKTNQEFMLQQGFKRDSKRQGWVSRSGRFVPDSQMKEQRV